MIGRIRILGLPWTLFQFFTVVCAGRRSSSFNGTSPGIASNASLLGDYEQESYFSFLPYTSVTGHALIDHDQKTIETQLRANTTLSRLNALKVYVAGAFSGSYAELTLDTPIPVDLEEAVPVMGSALVQGNHSVHGQIIGSVQAGDTKLLVQYQTSYMQYNWSHCHVGGNPDPVTEGCFAPTGELEIAHYNITTNYSYDPLQANFNSRTLQGFSLAARDKFYECGSSCPYSVYEKFYDYYGAYDYANQWILTAFAGGSTDFVHGNAQFGLHGTEGTQIAIQKGTVVLSTWMYVVGTMEDAIDDCFFATCGDGGGDCKDKRAHSWDAAVAFYMGSSATNSTGGYLLYALAQEHCRNFGTCLSSREGGGMAKVNMEILKEFNAGQQYGLEGKCFDLMDTVERISQLMAVPLIQGTLWHAYAIDKQKDTGEKTEAGGAVFAAAVLPLIHACNEADAAIIYDNLQVGNGGNVDFKDVKGALEQNYECLGITCEDVGDLVDSVTGGYLEDSEPCSMEDISRDFFSSVVKRRCSAGTPC